MFFCANDECHKYSELVYVPFLSPSPSQSDLKLIHMPHFAAADTNMAERPVDAAVFAVDSTSPVADPTSPVADPIATDHSKRSTLFRCDYLRRVVRRFVRRRWRCGGCGAAIPLVAPDNGAGGMDDASVAALEKVAANALAAASPDSWILAMS